MVSVRGKLAQMKRILQVLLACGLGLSFLVPIRAEEGEDQLSYSRQNPQLRRYFRSTCSQRGVGESSFDGWGQQIRHRSTHRTNQVILNRCIDKQIDRFIAEIFTGLERMQSDLAEIEQERDQCLDAGEGTMNKDPPFSRKVFGKLKKDANGIYRKLRNIFPFVKHKEESDLLIPEESRNACYTDEITRLGVHLDLAVRQIRGYFTGPQVVRAKEADDNMILVLFRVREIASSLEKR